MKSKITFFVILFCLAMKPFILAGQTVPRESFRITYIAGPEREPFALFIQSVYEELGIKVALIPAPAKRGLILLNDGTVDADVARLKRTAEEYPNVIIVEPKFAEGYLVLVCILGVPCSKEVLQDKKSHILSHAGSLNEFEIGEFQAKIILNEMASNNLKMLQMQHHSYSLFVADEYMLRALPTSFNFVRLKAISAYHVIHKKHAHLLPQIQQKLREKLPAFQASRVE